MKRPQNDEFSSFYANYVASVEGNNILVTLKNQQASTQSLLTSLDDKQLKHAYAPGKWTIAEVLCHLSDTERIMQNRILHFSRGEKQSLIGFEQDDYVSENPVEHLNLKSIASEMGIVRASTISLLENLSDRQWSNKGKANNVDFSVRALAYIIAGHELHHLKILQERYL